MVMTSFIERIAGAWLDAAEWADQTASELVAEHDTAATHWAEQAIRYEQQAGMVADLTITAGHA